jgi:hypothetical protein
MLFSKYWGIHVETHRLTGGIYEEMGSGAITYIPSFTKIGSGIQIFIGGGGFRQYGDFINLLYFQYKAG